MVDRPIPPYLGIHAIPEAEQPAANSLSDNLNLVWSFLDAFELDLQLYDYCNYHFHRLLEQERQLKPPEQLPANLARMEKFYLRSRSIPVRDGAMVIYQFGIAAQGVKKALALCPTVGSRAQVAHKTLRQALSVFNAAFPNSKNLRDAVAHPEVKTLTPADTQEHKFTGEYQSAAVRGGHGAATTTGAVEGRRLTETWKGKVFQYDLSEETLKILHDVAKAIYTAFPEPQWARR